MKNTYILLILLVPIVAWTQNTGVPTTAKAFIINFENNSTAPRIKVIIDDDLQDRYVVQSFTDSTLVFKTPDEEKEYQRLFDKRAELIKRIASLRTSPKVDTKAINALQQKNKDLLNPIDVSKYLQNRTYLKPGMETILHFEYFNKTATSVVQSVTVTTDFSKKESIKGILETTNEQARIDGHLVQLEPGIILQGANSTKNEGFKGKTFSSFTQLTPGWILDLEGKYREDGVFLVKEGKVYPDDHSDVDDVLKEKLNYVIRIDNTKNTVTMGDTTFKVVNDPTINDFIKKMGTKLIPSYLKGMNTTSRNYIDFRFHVIVDDSFNACAYPNGNVFINTGLILAVENPSQLAAVIGHEISHVINKHGRKKFNQENNINIAKNLVGKAGGIINSLAKSSTGTQNTTNKITFWGVMGVPLLVSAYSRDLERQADRCGLTLVENAGYDPREASAMWYALHKRTEQKKESSDDLLSDAENKIMTSLYSSHPRTVKRAHDTAMLIAKNWQQVDFSERKAVFAQQAKDFTTIKTKLKAILTKKK